MNSQPMNAETPTTRDALLDAAETLFAEQGIGGASLRAITQRAKANLAAVHYHFGSKEGLVRAVFARRLEPLNRERLRLLDEVEAADGGLEGILHALIWPVLRKGGAGTRDFKRLMGRLYAEPGAEMRQLMRQQFGLVVERFLQALRRACPALDEAELLSCFHFVIGAMVQLTLNAEMIREHSEGRVDTHDAERTTQRLVAFATAGFQARASCLEEENG